MLNDCAGGWSTVVNGFWQCLGCCGCTRPTSCNLIAPGPVFHQRWAELFMSHRRPLFVGHLHVCVQTVTLHAWTPKVPRINLCAWRLLTRTQLHTSEQSPQCYLNYTFKVNTVWEYFGLFKTVFDCVLKKGCEVLPNIFPWIRLRQ